MENNMNKDFEQMLEQSMQLKDNFSVGEQVRGVIVLIDKENIFVDISGKTEAVMSVQEFLDEDDKLTVKEGDQIQAYVSSVGRGEIKLVTKIGRVEANKELLSLAYQNGIPVQGLIFEVSNGGYTVMVSSIRCFCPFSQMDIIPVKEPEKLLNSSLEFRVTKYESRGQNVVLSRRVLLEEEQERLEADFKKRIKIGDTVTAKVRSIQDFGLFVDLGGVDALVPKSEISYSRNPDMGVYAVGQQLKVKILDLNWDRKRHSASIKQTVADPWDNIAQYRIGQEVDARITNFIPAGAFAEIEPGLEGLIHISKLSMTKRIRKPQDVVSLGQGVRVRILQMDSKARKVSLELVTGETDPWLNISENLTSKVHTGIVEMVKENGVHVRLKNGMLGFVYFKELINGKTRDLLKFYPVGKELQLAVNEVDYADRKLFLSEKQAMSRKEQSEFESYNKEETVSQSGSSLGNLFKDQFAKLQKEMDK